MIWINLFKKQKQTQTQERNLWLLKGKGHGRGINWEFGIDVYILLCLKQITNKDPLYNTVKSAQQSVIAKMGYKFEKEQIHIYV